MKSIKTLGLRFLAALATVATTVATAGTVTYYHNDLSGSPVAATNAAGQVIWRETYRPYGERTIKPSTDNQVWFTSRREDADTGLVYMGARYYDPVIGRFLSMDPVGFDDRNIHSHNRYAYANNNPLRFKDPDGKAAETVFDAISFGISVAMFRNDPTIGNFIGAAVDGIALAVPFVPGGVGAIRAAGNAGEAAARSIDGALQGEKVLYRLGESSESAARLGRKAGEAENAIGLHGVSASTTKPRDGTACSMATCASLEAKGFKVEPTPTRNDPGHHTVVLPKPVTKEVANDFNQAFGRN